MWLPILLVVLIFVFLISAAWTNFVGAPWVPTSMSLVREMLELAEVGPDDTVYDLGCGDGRTVITAARRYGARAVGIEIDPLRYLWCQILVNVFRLRGRVQILFGNFFNQDLSDADVVTCYLLQDTNEKLQEKLNRELRPGARVVSNTFTFPGMNPLRKENDARLYLFNQIKSTA
jgi:predicted RNA methylase